MAKKKKKVKVKDKCCKKYLKSGKYCKDCPIRAAMEAKKKTDSKETTKKKKDTKSTKKKDTKNKKGKKK